MSERFPASEADPSFVQELEVYIQNVHGDQLAFEWKGENDTLFGPYPALLYVRSAYVLSQGLMIH
jgi:hypothetical protein